MHGRGDEADPGAADCGTGDPWQTAGKLRKFPLRSPQPSSKVTSKRGTTSTKAQILTRVEVLAGRAELFTDKEILAILPLNFDFLWTIGGLPSRRSLVSHRLESKKMSPLLGVKLFACVFLRLINRIGIWAIPPNLRCRLRRRNMPRICPHGLGSKDWVNPLKINGRGAFPQLLGLTS